MIRITPTSNSFFTRSISSMICAWTVTSSAVVGSSAISTSGLWTSAIAIIARWRMPPENWCGIVARPQLRVRDADRAEQLDGAAPRLRLRDVGVRLDGLGDLVADAVHRVQAGERVLEDHRDVAAADLLQLARGFSASRSVPSNRISPEMSA